MNPSAAQPPTSAGTPSLSVRTLRSFEEVEELRGVWEEWQTHPNSDIDFYLSRFHVRPEFLQPCVIVVCRDACPETILVGRTDDLRMDLKIGYIHLPRPRVRAVSVLYSGLLGNQSVENSKLIITEIMRLLRQGEVDLASFSNLRVDSPIYDLATKLPGVMSRHHFPVVDLHCSMTLPSSLDDIYRGLTPKHRSHIKRQARQLLNDQALSAQISCFRGTDEVDRMIRDVEDVARKTYQRGLGVGFVDNVEMRERLGLAARKGWLRSYVLYLANQPCAFCVGTLYGGTYYTDFVGYNPIYAKYRPGTFLLMRMLGEFCSEGVKQVDFGYGVEEYKQRFGNCKWHEAMVTIYAPTARSLGLKVVVTLTLLIDHCARKTLERIKVLPRLKRFWRKHVTNRGTAAPQDETEAEQ